MFKAFYWMFQHKDFKKHLIFLITVPILMMILLAILIMFTIDFLKMYVGDFLTTCIVCIIIILPFLFIQGYFWNLMMQIIERKEEILLNNVYGGKVEKKTIIELPELNVFKHIWRGIASIVATNLSLLLPYYTIVILTLISSFLIIGFIVAPFILIGFYIIYIILLPMLCWNYGKTNSVFAMLDILKGIRLLQDYPKNYILTVLPLAIIYTFNFGLDYFIINTLKINDMFSIIGLIIIALKSLYFLFVYAYLIGTMLPCDEF